MTLTRTGVIVAGLAIVAGTSALGYGLSKRVERTSSVAPSPTTEAFVAQPVEGTPVPEVAAPSPTPSPSPPPAVAPAETARVPVSLTIESVPASVTSGTPLIVHWKVQGPARTLKVSSRLAARYEGEGSVRVQSSQISSSELPARFEATVTPTGSGLLTVTAEAVVNGQTLQAEQNLRVE